MIYVYLNLVLIWILKFETNMLWGNSNQTWQGSQRVTKTFFAFWNTVFNAFVSKELSLIKRLGFKKSFFNTLNKNSKQISFKISDPKKKRFKMEKWLKSVTYYLNVQFWPVTILLGRQINRYFLNSYFTIDFYRLFNNTFSSISIFYIDLLIEFWT